jgi:DNA-binding transcriptional regulator YdaS (Cro superfamily)
MKAINKAISFVGGQKAMAALVDKSQSAVSKWARGIAPVPPDTCLQVEEITGGKVTVEELRPDLKARWAYIRGTGCSQSCPQQGEAA